MNGGDLFWGDRLVNFVRFDPQPLGANIFKEVVLRAQEVPFYVHFCWLDAVCTGMLVSRLLLDRAYRFDEEPPHVQEDLCCFNRAEHR